MSNNHYYKKQIYYFQVKLASPQQIRSWGKIIAKPDTINYKTLIPETGGLFCEKVFGKLHQNWNVLISPRRYKMGYIRLNSPVLHIWFWKTTPNYIGLILSLSRLQIEEKIYLIFYDNSKKLPQRDFKKKIAQLKFTDSKSRGALALYINLKQINFSALLFHLYSELPIWFKLIRYLTDFSKNFTLNQRNFISEIKSYIRKVLKSKLLYFRLIKQFERSGLKPIWMILLNLPVLPPDLRPLMMIDSHLASSDLNEFYRRIIYRSNRLCLFIKNNAPNIILIFDQRLIQEAVDAVLDNSRTFKPLREKSISRKRPLKSLSEFLKGKTGRFRQNLLGKRVDYSGRSVIIADPTLTIYQCGLPRELALKLFQPFLIKRLVRWGLVANIRQAKQRLDKLTVKPYLWDILALAVRTQIILLNRAPTLHRLGIQAFQPIITANRAIGLHPLVCSSFNADFDGDQMAVHVPLSWKSQLETQLLFSAETTLFSLSSNITTLLPSQDMVLGCFYSTLTELPSNFFRKNKRIQYFYHYTTILYFYQRRVLNLHSLIWFKLDNLTSILNLTQNEIPLELRVYKSGINTTIYRQLQLKLNIKGIKSSQFVRTTVGRVFINQLLKNFSIN